MPVTRRILGLSLLASPIALAQTSPDPRLAERSVGPAEAPLVVSEFFSLTCSHCAAFHTGTWPQVKRELVETGRIRMVFIDFPLDDIGLRAAMVARVEREEGKEERERDREREKERRRRRKGC